MRPCPRKGAADLSSAVARGRSRTSQPKWASPAPPHPSGSTDTNSSVTSGCSTGLRPPAGTRPPPQQTPSPLIESMRREHKWSSQRLAFELETVGISISRRTVSRLLAQLGLNRRQFIDPNGELNRASQPIIAARPGHMVHVDVKKVGRMPDGGGWRVHGRASPQAHTVARNKTRSSRTGYVYLH